MSLPLLASVLTERGYTADCLDLNAKYWQDCILNTNFLKKRLKILKSNLNDINLKKFQFADLKEKYIIQKTFPFLTALIEKENKILELINKVDTAVSILKSKEDFYNINKFEFALKTVKNASNFLFYTYFVSNEINKRIGQKLSCIEYFIKNKTLNPFYEYYTNQIDSHIFDKYDSVLISQPFDIQNLGCWTLAYLLKNKADVKVCCGGNYVSRLKDTIINNEIIFKDYFDYFLLGLGEESIVQFASFREGKTAIDNVKGLVYYENNEIKLSEAPTYLTNPLKRPDISFKGINFDDYLIPEPVIPLQVSKGCPWGKCTFCVFHLGKPHYQIIPPEQAADEVKYLNKNFGIKRFEFADESLTPEYYYKFAKKIIEYKLDIKYYGFARFDNTFTDNILQTMYKSGFRIFEWGYESPSKNVMKIFNKGIDIANRHKILEDAGSQGIWNHCLTITSIPFETLEDEISDLKTYINNKNLFHSRLIARFILYKNSPIAPNAENYNMTNIKDNGNLSITYSYERKDKDIYNSKRSAAEKLERTLYEEIYGKECWLNLVNTADEYLFLYVSHYGKDKVLNMKSSLYALREEL